MAGRRTAGSSHEQYSSKECRDRHVADEEELLDGVDRVAALKEDCLLWAILTIYLWCCMGYERLCKMLPR